MGGRSDSHPLYSGDVSYAPTSTRNAPDTYTITYDHNSGSGIESVVAQFVVKNVEDMAAKQMTLVVKTPDTSFESPAACGGAPLKKGPFKQSIREPSPD